MVWSDSMTWHAACIHDSHMLLKSISSKMSFSTGAIQVVSNYFDSDKIFKYNVQCSVWVPLFVLLLFFLFWYHLRSSCDTHIKNQTKNKEGTKNYRTHSYIESESKIETICRRHIPLSKRTQEWFGTIWRFRYILWILNWIDSFSLLF